MTNTTKEIIIKLIDQHLISGEEAYNLIEELVCKHEIYYVPTIQPYPTPTLEPIVTWQDYEILTTTSTATAE